LRAHRRLRIFAFEPVPSVFALAERNMALYQGDASITLFKCALGRVASIAEGVMDPGLSMTASLRPGDFASAVRPNVGILDWAHALTRDLERLGMLPVGWGRLIEGSLESPVVRPLGLVAIVALAAGVRLRAGGGLKKRHFACQVRSLSEVILENNVARIDVLKVDVEGSEWEVLSGLENKLWPRIRQAVVEVHDVAGRVGEITRLFRQHGFHTEVDQQDWETHRLLGVYTVYARRDA
jgi:hypothetical protein